jgi:hypothetical protein
MHRPPISLLAVVAVCLLPIVARSGQAEPNSALGIDRDDIVLWLQAGSFADLPGGSEVARWQDSNRSDLAAIQPIAERRPTFESNVKNGLPVVRFVASARQTLVVPDVALAAESTQFVVFSPTGLGRNPPFFEHGTNVNSVPGSLLYGTVPMFTMRRGDTFASVAGQAGWVYLGRGHSDLELILGMGRIWVVVSAVYRQSAEGGTIEVRRNGTPQSDPATVTGASGMVTAAFHIGSRDQIEYWSDMDLGEVILVNRPLRDEEIGVIEDHLSRKWAVDLNESPDGR